MTKTHRRLFLIFGLIALFLAVVRDAQADDVQIRSNFPSLYGNYGLLEATDAVSVAGRSGNVTLAAGANARVAIGNAAPEGGAERTLGVRATGGNFGQSAFRGSNGWGVLAGVIGTTGGLQAVDGGNTAGVLALNPGGGTVGVNTTNPLYVLHVNGSIALDDGSGAGAIQYDYDAVGGAFGHAYAP